MIEKKDIKDLLSVIENISSKDKTNQGSDLERLQSITAIERQFNFKLPLSYCKYVKVVDNAPKIFSPINFYDDYGSKLDLIGINDRLRNQDISYPVIPDFLIVISNGHDDNYICFDTRYPKSEGEYPLAFWSTATPYYKKELEDNFPKMKLAQSQFTYISPNFPNYFYQLLVQKYG